jgi:hypothetical protein
MEQTGEPLRLLAGMPDSNRDLHQLEGSQTGDERIKRDAFAEHTARNLGRA